MYLYIYIYTRKLLKCLFAHARSKAKTGPGERSVEENCPGANSVGGASSSATPPVTPVKAKPNAGLAQIMLKLAELKHLEAE